MRKLTYAAIMLALATTAASAPDKKNHSLLNVGAADVTSAASSST
jgi:hypothetical protein